MQIKNVCKKQLKANKVQLTLMADEATVQKTSNLVIISPSNTSNYTDNLAMITLKVFETKIATLILLLIINKNNNCLAKSIIT